MGLEKENLAWPKQVAMADVASRAQWKKDKKKRKVEKKKGGRKKRFFAKGCKIAFRKEKKSGLRP